LSKKVFELIEIHKKVIGFFGKYIAENKRQLLEVFPYNFGYDDFILGLMSNKEYKKSKS